MARARPFWLWLLLGLCFSAQAYAERPNVVFILCDDLGIHDLQCYGRKDHRTPHLDRLAQQGMRFTSAYCPQPICSASRAALLTGKCPARLHLTTFLPGRPDCLSQKLLHPQIEMQLPLTEKLLPRYFKEAGYVTAAVGKWHVGGKGFGPLEQGFDLFHEGRANTKPSATEGSKGEHELTSFAEQFIKQNKDRPFFLYLSHNSPHLPYAAAAESIAMNSTAFEPVYAAMIETLDETVGRLLAKLDALKLTDNTLVIFTSDNGGVNVPEGPHQRLTHNGPYRAGKGFLYEGGLRIPLIVRWPEHISAGVTVHEPIVNSDWIPTFMEFLGQQTPTGLDGVSLASLLTGKGPAPARSFYWHFPHYTNQGSRPAGAMRQGPWKLIEPYDEGEPELYNLDTDVGEQQNLSAQQPARLATMRTSLADWRQQVNAQTNQPNPKFDSTKYQTLYRDLDASRFAPLEASSEDWKKIWNWRKEMDAVVPVK